MWGLEGSRKDCERRKKVKVGFQSRCLPSIAGYICSWLFWRYRRLVYLVYMAEGALHAPELQSVHAVFSVWLQPARILQTRISGSNRKSSVSALCTMHQSIARPVVSASLAQLSGSCPAPHSQCQREPEEEETHRPEKSVGF